MSISSRIHARVEGGKKVKKKKIKIKRETGEEEDVRRGEEEVKKRRRMKREKIKFSTFCAISVFL